MNSHPDQLPLSALNYAGIIGAPIGEANFRFRIAAGAPTGLIFLKPFPMEARST